LIVLLGDGKGGFARQAGPALEKTSGCRGYHVRLVDLDGDQRSEILAEFAGEQAGLAGLIASPGCVGEGSLRAWTVRRAGG
jgi:hypothetical protein